MSTQDASPMPTGDSHRIPFLNCHIDNVEFDDVMATIDSHVQSGTPGFMVSLNTDIAVQLEKDPAFAEAYAAADLALMDSQPLIWLAKRRGIQVREKLSGSDLMPRICEVAAQRGWSCFFLGGMGDVPATAAANLSQHYPGLVVAGTLSPDYGFEKTDEGLAQVIQAVRDAHPDILFICLGTPKSEKILYPHLDEFGVPFTLSVGAAIDFAAGTANRAPEWMQHAGLEWLYRFAQEPKRLFKRYFVDSWKLADIWRNYVRSEKHAHSH